MTERVTNEELAAMFLRGQNMRLRYADKMTVQTSDWNRLVAELQQLRAADAAVVDGGLRQAAERLMNLASKIERASSEEEENRLCDERDGLLSLFRKADATLKGHTND